MWASLKRPAVPSTRPLLLQSPSLIQSPGLCPSLKQEPKPTFWTDPYTPTSSNFLLTVRKRTAKSWATHPGSPYPTRASSALVPPFTSYVRTPSRIFCSPSLCKHFLGKDGLFPDLILLTCSECSDATNYCSVLGPREKGTGQDLLLLPSWQTVQLWEGWRD